MSKLISGKEALIALANGKEVLWRTKTDAEIKCIKKQTPNLGDALSSESYRFWIKPRTITINGIEVPAPADDEDYHHQGIWILNSLELKEYGFVVLDITDELPRYWWKSEEEIKQVVAALRRVFGGGK